MSSSAIEGFGFGAWLMVAKQDDERLADMAVVVTRPAPSAFGPGTDTPFPSLRPAEAYGTQDSLSDMSRPLRVPRTSICSWSHTLAQASLIWSR